MNYWPNNPLLYWRCIRLCFKSNTSLKSPFYLSTSNDGCFFCCFILIIGGLASRDIGLFLSAAKYHRCFHVWSQIKVHLCFNRALELNAHSTFFANIGWKREINLLNICVYFSNSGTSLFLFDILLYIYYIYKKNT